jgi:enoyl-CoA hydratase/carnithine racemase
MNNIQGVMIKGMGDGRAFCAGGDVRAAALAVRNGDVCSLPLTRLPSAVSVLLPYQCAVAPQTLTWIHGPRTGGL